MRTRGVFYAYAQNRLTVCIYIYMCVCSHMLSFQEAIARLLVPSWSYVLSDWYSTKRCPSSEDFAPWT